MEKVYYNWNQIQGMTLDLINSMDCQNWQPEYVVGITRGGLSIATLISHWYNIPMKTLNVRLLDGDATDREIDSNMIVDAANGKKILIVDDINDTGATINWIKQSWKEYAPDWKAIGHNSWDEIFRTNVRFATLVHNEASDASVYYCAEEINKLEKNVWIVFPWEEWWMPK